jgi:hypothetical protein
MYIRLLGLTDDCCPTVASVECLQFARILFDGPDQTFIRSRSGDFSCVWFQWCKHANSNRRCSSSESVCGSSGAHTQNSANRSLMIDLAYDEGTTES